MMNFVKCNLKRLSIIGFCLIFHFVGHAQCQLTTSTGSYNAICFQKLYKDESPFGIEVAIARSEGKGFLVVKLPQLSAQSFSKKMYLYLEDSKIITLTNIGQEWKVNNELFGQFNLNESEISSLKKSNIAAFRYFPYHSSDDAEEYYNRDFVSSLTNEKVNKVDFSFLIKTLFDD